MNPYYEKNRERLKENSRQYYHNNKEKVREYNRRYSINRIAGVKSSRDYKLTDYLVKRPIENNKVCIVCKKGFYSGNKLVKICSVVCSNRRINKKD